MVTPFDADGRVSESAFVDLLQHLLANGSDGVVVAGSTGEGATLDDAEKLRLFELAVAESGDATVIAGTGSNDTAHSAELAQIDNVAAVKQANPDDIAPIEGMDLLSGNDETLAEVLDKGGTGGICVASHIVGPEMHRMVDEPDQRAAINESLQDVWRAMMVTTNPIPVKTAVRMLGHD